MADDVRSIIGLRDEMINEKIKFINNYKSSKNAATSSLLDPNANISQKNICTMQTELFKDFAVQINNKMMYYKIGEMFGYDLAEEYIDQLKNHEIYKHDNSSLSPYCVSITMYPFLLNGTKDLGGSSDAPKHFKSFCGAFISLVFEIASQFAGAVATTEFLMYADYFARKDYGDNYLETHKEEVLAGFDLIIYTLNEPAAARNYQAVFWNISIFDEPYFEALFGDFAFPDGVKPEYESVHKLQTFFMNYFNDEREEKLLTFPVITQASLYHDNGEPYDYKFHDFVADQLSKGNSFFNYQSDSPDTLSSCCRLANKIEDKPVFSYSLGAGGVATGSIGVITLNLNRLEQDKHRNLEDEILKIHKYHAAYRSLKEDDLNSGLLPAYKAGFISMDKQFSTIGFLGLVEAAEYRGIEVSYNKDFIDFCESKLKVIYDLNRKAKEKFGFLVNTEAIPGENVGVRFAKWDKEDGYESPRDCYNSYFYLPEDHTCLPMDKFKLHGKEVLQYLDGGSALHLNLDDFPTKDGYKDFLKYAAQCGCNYWCTNIPSTCCNDCGYIGKKKTEKCIKCGSKDVDYAVRVIGFLKKIKDFSEDRQKEASTRVYHEHK